MIEDAVEIWSVLLEAPPLVTDQYRRFLSGYEIERAHAFAFASLRRNYVISHGALRLLLGHYLHCDPLEVNIRLGDKGKPGVSAGTGLQFNLSHSRKLAVYAFTAGCSVGIDVEELRKVDDAEQIAAGNFCSEEISELKAIPEGKERDEAFLRCWTRKEAYVKAIGDGLQVPLNRFCVSVGRDQPAKLVHIDGDATTAANWTLQHIKPEPQHVGAVAYAGSARTLLSNPLLAADEFLNRFSSGKGRFS